jgi:hypothetical protein
MSNPWRSEDGELSKLDEISRLIQGALRAGQ